MQEHKCLTFALLTSLGLLAGCGEDFSGGSRVLAPQQEEQSRAPFPQEFNTRLNSSLLISGTRCKGDETTELNGRGSLCEARNYLIYIDNVNICDSSAICTEFVVIPIVASLEDIDARNPDSRVFFITSKSPTTGAQDNILENVAVESDMNGNGSVFFK